MCRRLLRIYYIFRPSVSSAFVSFCRIFRNVQLRSRAETRDSESFDLQPETEIGALRTDIGFSIAFRQFRKRPLRAIITGETMWVIYWKTYKMHPNNREKFYPTTAHSLIIRLLNASSCCWKLGRENNGN